MCAPRCPHLASPRCLLIRLALPALRFTAARDPGRGAAPCSGQKAAPGPRQLPVKVIYGQPPGGEPLHQMGCLLLRRRAQVAARLLPRRITGRRRGARALHAGFCSQAFRKTKHPGSEHASNTVGARCPGEMPRDAQGKGAARAGSSSAGPGSLLQPGGGTGPGDRAGGDLPRRWGEPGEIQNM